MIFLNNECLFKKLAKLNRRIFIERRSSAIIDFGSPYRDDERRILISRRVRDNSTAMVAYFGG